MDIFQLRRCIRSQHYRLSLHAQKERYFDDINVADIEQAILHGQILEDYANDPRGSSCLVLGYSKNRPIHIVCTLLPSGLMRVITVYIPQKPKWLTPQQRRK